mmetsp:Transcript_72799/g.226149  ORF Transcript_72799/g.226149 Transcript_72799/m.226149 type:complete len:281 (-) Transcript_72799:71-913(-)
MQFAETAALRVRAEWPVGCVGIHRGTFATIATTLAKHDIVQTATSEHHRCLRKGLTNKTTATLGTQCATEVGCQLLNADLMVVSDRCVDEVTCAVPVHKQILIAIVGICQCAHLLHGKGERAFWRLGHSDPIERLREVTCDVIEPHDPLFRVGIEHRLRSEEHRRSRKFACRRENHTNFNPRVQIQRGVQCDIVIFTEATITNADMRTTIVPIRFGTITIRSRKPIVHALVVHHLRVMCIHDVARRVNTGDRIGDGNKLGHARQDKLRKQPCACQHHSGN